MQNEHWILCLICGGKTRLKVSVKYECVVKCLIFSCKLGVRVFSIHSQNSKSKKRERFHGHFIINS